MLAIPLSISLILFGWQWWLRHELQGLRLAATAYAEMTWLARLAGLTQQPSETPQEYAQRLASILPEHAATIRGIATAYTTERYRRGAAVRVPAEADRRMLQQALWRYAVQHGLRRIWLPLRRPIA